MHKRSYNERLLNQIMQYKNMPNMHAQLPEMYQYWRSKHIHPRVKAVLEVDNHIEFYSKHFFDRLCQNGSHTILSLGCGDGDVEVRVAKDLIKLGVRNFIFKCVEVSSEQITRAIAME